MQAIAINRTDSGQFLTVSHKNYSLTYYAAHAKKWSYDVINRFLGNKKYTPALLWEHIKPDVIFSFNGYTSFDDTVLNKRNTKKIEIVKSQYSGATGGVTAGIGVVSLVYYNPDIDKLWVIDYQNFSPDHDGTTKLDHLLNMLNNVVYSKKFLVKRYFLTHGVSTHKIMQHDKAVNKLTLSDDEMRHGVEIHIKGFAKNKHVNLFKFTLSINKVGYIITNNKTQKSSQAAQDEFGFRWVIESMHREMKQLTEIECGQCRKQRIQRNHISCAFLKRTANTIRFTK